MSMSRIGIAEVAKQGQNHPTFLLSTGKGNRYSQKSPSVRNHPVVPAMLRLASGCIGENHIYGPPTARPL